MMSAPLSRLRQGKKACCSTATEKKSADIIAFLVLGFFTIWGIWNIWKKAQQHKQAHAYYRKVLEFLKKVHCTEEADDSEGALQWKRSYANLLDWCIAHDPGAASRDTGPCGGRLTF